ncbi:MAG: hypothetical protein V9G23_14710 [Giesbergeria sp.]
MAHDIRSPAERLRGVVYEEADIRDPRIVRRPGGARHRHRGAPGLHRDARQGQPPRLSNTTWT